MIIQFSPRRAGLLEERRELLFARPRRKSRTRADNGLIRRVARKWRAGHARSAAGRRNLRRRSLGGRHRQRRAVNGTAIFSSLHESRVIQALAARGPDALRPGGGPPLHQDGAVQVLLHNRRRVLDDARVVEARARPHSAGQGRDPRVREDLRQREPVPRRPAEEAGHQLCRSRGHRRWRDVHLGCADLLDRLFLRRRGERRPRHQHLEQQDTERPDVHGSIMGLVEHHLWGQVVHRSAEGTPIWALGRQLHAPPQVAQLGQQVVTEQQDVLWLDVSVGDPQAVQVRQAAGAVGEELRRPGFRQPGHVAAEI
mmetsp:Transcript_30801/g.88981  ORF Transcript_30801/g.88981 Transcript_30801/m.88981 type:complete len:312 (+) Transcript_30801:841-1776(+)